MRRGKTITWLMIFLLSAFVTRASADQTVPLAGDAVIRGRTDEGDKGAIVVTTTGRVAGAIHSLTWGGKEFIDSTDHGRQLQSAANFDCGSPYSNETFNPTEAGSRADGIGKTSSSRLLHFIAKYDSVQSTNRMAFWLKPDESSGGHPAKNTTVLSDHLITKRVQIGYKQLPQVISYDVTFSMPLGERHNYAQFEAVTGYMPAEFETFWRYQPAKRTLEALGDGPGEQRFPVVMATSSGSHAMGIFSPDQPSPSFENAGYGRFRFGPEQVVKWNCVFRVRSNQGIPAGEFRYRNFVIVGTLETVRASLQALHEEFGKN